MKMTMMMVALLATPLMADMPKATTDYKPMKPTASTFYVFTERGSRENHYIPSGWMGDYGDLKFNQGWKDNTAKGETCLKVVYTGERKQAAGWTGIYWQMPANNWGDKRGGYDLSGYKSLTFMARGEKGGEMLDKFMMGGITGQTEEGDTDSADTGMVELTKDWKLYTIDLSKADLSHIIGGFGFALNADSNPAGATFYIDEIAFQRK